ncbi:MAG: CDP-glycerol glycerophosphotransferase family protein [Aeriscardovia sp.]|nr:CDP-glycerol glycerophosphotransferase family protein [Aeriscardovia sp.]MBR2756220.1 CDP-glycerol glycerophosphotransferase family protein [Lachnospiraceae bacterium]
MLLYIDPGTGSMLFTILIGMLGAGFFAFRKLFLKLRFLGSGGKAETMNASKIPYVLYAESKRYWNLFEPICDEFECREVPLLYLTSSQDDPAFQKDYKFIERQFIGEGNKSFAKLNMLNASIVLATTPGLDVYQWKRSKNVDWYIHIPHMASDVTLYRMFGLDYYDAILTTGEYQSEEVRELEKVRNLPPKELKVVGLPYMDELKKKLDQCKEKTGRERTILLAPSWGSSGILTLFGEKVIDALVKTGYKIIIRPHPQSFVSEKEMIDRLMVKYPKTDKLSWDRDSDNFSALESSDILISDFSGVIFDYVFVFDKPVIYADYDFDFAPYDCSWLDNKTWTFEVLKKIGRKLDESEFGHMKEIIDECIADEGYAAARREAGEEGWQCRGEGAKNIADYMIQKHSEISAADSMES